MEGRENVLVQLGNLSRKPSSVVRGILENGTAVFHKIKELQNEIKKHKKVSEVKNTDVLPELIIG